jgi:hypothetical protein
MGMGSESRKASLIMRALEKLPKGSEALD